MLVGSTVVKKRIQVGSTSLPIKPQLEHDSETIPSLEVSVTLALAPDSPLMPGSGVIPVSTFNTLTFALTLGEHVAEYRSRSPSFSVALPVLPMLPLHPPLARDQLSAFSTLNGASD
ncbi:hypothetical protein K503DRAFT_49774 [Rhizopogon vinicolor AM-OR11-026]|uniref:Uncharacterized protein n=1 Tax=Rhizopogon vinicolor AM-OR11-026 TaxID=1314800 RepID=A0A1B7N4T5_9AGAM|nr:hypothetical protein K503DRAFT_49774 [Rhizopogon vinicolor AM-OR11-026]